MKRTETQEEGASSLSGTRIKNIGSLLGTLEAGFGVLWVYSTIAFDFWSARCLGFRKPGAQSKGKLLHHFRSKTVSLDGARDTFSWMAVPGDASLICCHWNLQLR